MDFNYQEGRLGIPLVGLTLPHFSVCSKPGPWISNAICCDLFFLMFDDVRGECSWPSLFKISFHNLVAFH
jgi:hypothetical protein